MTIKFKKLSDKAVAPIRTTDSGAGYNLTAVQITTEMNERGQLVLVYHSNISIELPEGYEARVRPMNNIFTKTLRMCSDNVVTNDTDIVARFISTTDVVPAVYEEGAYFGQLVINKIESTELIEFIDTTNNTSAPIDAQSHPEQKDESTNSGVSEGSGEAENSLEQA